jgi:hypothetical protein
MLVRSYLQLGHKSAQLLYFCCATVPVPLVGVELVSELVQGVGEPVPLLLQGVQLSRRFLLAPHSVPLSLSLCLKGGN